jgi:hypothetical protein
MTPNTLHQYRPLAKFHADRHFIYITTHSNESKEELQFYYKQTDEDMVKITKEWPTKFLIPVEDEEIFDLDIIGSPLVTRFEHDGQTSTKKNKKKGKVKNIETDEEEIASEESRPDSPTGGGGDKVSQEEGEEEGENKDKYKVTLSKDPPTKAKTSKKRNVSPQKPSTIKNT